MRALLVVVSAPDGDDSSCFKEVSKPADAQAFLEKFAVKTFDIAILRELSALHPEEAAVREQLAKGLGFTIYCLMQEQQEEAAEKLFKELCALAEQYPEDENVSKIIRMFSKDDQ